MAKKRSFLGFLASLFMLFFSANAFAAGYICNDIKKYTSCNAGYYVSDCGSKRDGSTIAAGNLTVGNSCNACPANHTCSGGLTCPSENTITATATNKTLTYTGSPQSCTGGVTVTSPSGTTVTYSTTNGSGYASTLTKTDAGTYTIYYKITATNYTTKTGSYTCTINPATMSVSAPTKTLTYNGTTTTNGSAQSCANVSVTAPSSGATVTYSTSSNGTYSSTAPTLTNAGSTTVYYKVTATNYTTKTGTYTCTMNTKGMTVTAPTKTLTYNGSAQSCANVTVSVPSSGATVTYSTSSSGTYSSTAPTLTNAGSTTVYYKVTGSNFTEKTGSYSCTMGKATCNMTLSASSGSVAYSSSTTFTVNNAQGTATVASSNTSIATASISGSTVTATCKTTYGTSTITVSAPGNSNYNACTDKTYTITCNKGTITLNNQSATTAGSTAVYQTYDTNVYSDSARSKAMTTSANGITVPSKTGYTFGGYYDSTSYTAQYINASGYITSAGLTAGKALKTNGTWYAKWTKDCSTSRSCATDFSGYTGTYNQCTGNESTQCTKTCSGNDTSNCPVNASCTYDPSKTYYYPKSGLCPVKTISCNDGYYKNSTNGCDKRPTGGIPCADGSEGLCCDVGYTINAAKNSCIANKYNVTYNCGTGTGTAPTADQATYNVSYTPKSSTCTAPSNSVFVGWTISGTSTVVTAGANFTWTYTEAKTFTAKYNATACDDGKYLNGTTCTSCPSGYTHSDAGATSSAKCYKTCSNSCTSPSCPANSASCTFDTTKTWSGKQYYNTSTCVIDAGQNANCPVKTLSCNARYYTNGSVCSACSSLGNGSYTMSLTTNNSSASGCYATCSIDCTKQTCPAHATCTHGTEKSNGGIYYPSTTCTAPAKSCTITITPDEGYVCSGNTCSPVVTPVTLAPNHTDSGGSAAVTIYQKYATGWYSNSAATTTLAKAAIPTRTNWTFTGYYTAATNGTLVIAADGTLPVNTTYSTSSAVTLYAHWSQNTTACQSGKYYNGTSHVACPAGKYCPGTGSTPIGTAGCATACPTDSKGGTVTSAASSTSKDACYVNRTNVAVSHGHANQMCYITSSTNVYDKSCTISVTSCDAGYYREQANSTTCSVVGNGYYSAASDLTRNACSALNGAASNVTTETQTSVANTACYNTCSNVAITNGTRIPVNTKEYFNGTTFPTCSYTTSCSAGYTASGTTCTPKILTITLNPNNGGANSTIYLKYATGWYSNAAATTSITSVTVPTKGDSQAFEGYTSTNNDVVVDSTGKLTTTYTIFSANATITAQYGNRTAIHCNAGTYYTGTGTTCTQCTAGSYCPGVDTFVGVGTPRGINTCQSLNGTYTHADGAAATTISSLAGSTAATNCYATNLVYKSATNNADGYQTCYYNAATKVYSDNCKDIKVTKCSGGHYLASATATDCAEVGVGYYSPSNTTTRTKCPFLDNNIGVKTFGTTSTEVTQCYLGNIWYVPAGGHSAHRRSCYHIDSATSASPDAGYSYNCNVSVIVTCDGGYYDNGTYKNSNMERDCIAITDKDSYSPAQSYFTSEPAQPDQETPGSSTKLMSCPATKSIVNGSTQSRVFQSTWTASDYAVCKYTQASCNAGYNAVTNGNEMKCETCPANKFCTGGGTQPQSCPVDTATGATGIADAGAKSIEECYVYHDNYAGFQNGTASAKCTYSSTTRGYTNCSVKALTCIAGYYYNGSSTSPACIKVGYGFWSPAGDLGRNSCAVGETTDTDVSSSASDCRTCEAGYICDPSSPEKPKTCSELTNGQYPKSHAGTATVDKCYRDCAIATNAATMKGYDYKGIASTCEIDHCIAGYTNNTTKKVCELCPAGSFCGGGVDPNCPANQNCGTPKTCSSLGDGEWKYSDIGASSPADCYRKCEILNLDGGKGIPANDREYYDTMCQYRGVDPEGNPCDIEGDKCITRACKPSYEMVNGVCTPCNRDHALSYKSGGNCMVDSCEAGWHPYAQRCEADISECDAPNALRAEKQWDYAKNAYGICTIKECEDGFHISSNACVADVQECMVEHGIGEKEWNHTTNTWGECVATSCDAGYTNDPYETSEPTKQCGHCKNKFGIKGELAASSYSRGCTISACMYQGELYNLENNECNPICDVNGYEDETGTMKWNPSTHKCERKCKTGYVMW